MRRREGKRDQQKWKRTKRQRDSDKPTEEKTDIDNYRKKERGNTPEK